MPVFWSIVENEAKLQARIKELEKENERISKQRDNLSGVCDRVIEENDYLEQENKKLKHKNELQEKALIKLCLKHHYDSIIIGWEIVIDMENYTVVEKKKPKEEKLF